MRTMLMIKMRYTAFIITLSHLIIAPKLFAQSKKQPDVITGPLLFRSQSPSQFFMPTPLPRSVPVSTKNVTEIKASYAVSNYWSNDDDFKLDLQAIDTVIDMRHSFGNGWAIFLTAAFRKAINAEMDQLVMNFHDLFGLGQDGRKEVEKNDTLIDLPKYGIYYGKEYLNLFISKELHLGLQKTIINGGKSSYSLGITSHINGSILQSNNGHTFASATAQIDQQIPFSSSILYLNIASTHILDDHQLRNHFDDKIKIATDQWIIMLGFEYFSSKNLSYHIEYIALEPVIEDKELLDLTLVSNEIQFGIRAGIGIINIEFAIMENLFTFYNSADVGFQLGISTKF